MFFPLLVKKNSKTSPFFTLGSVGHSKRKKWGIYSLILPNYTLDPFLFFSSQFESYSLCLSYSFYLISLLLLLLLYEFWSRDFTLCHQLISPTQTKPLNPSHLPPPLTESTQTLQLNLDPHNSNHHASNNIPFFPSLNCHYESTQYQCFLWAIFLENHRVLY